MKIDVKVTDAEISRLELKIENNELGMVYGSYIGYNLISENGESVSYQYVCIDEFPEELIEQIKPHVNAIAKIFDDNLDYQINKKYNSLQIK